jgi:hypothetical protein
MTKMIRFSDEMYEHIAAHPIRKPGMSVTLTANILMGAILNQDYQLGEEVVVGQSPDFQKKSEASLIQDVFGGEQLDIVEDFETLKRTPQVILAEIRKLEAEMDEKIAYCQDEEQAHGILINYRADIQKLWNEYHEVKG